MPTATDYARSAQQFGALASDVLTLSAPVRPLVPAVRGGVVQVELDALVRRLETAPQVWAHQLDGLRMVCLERQAQIEALESQWRFWRQHQAAHQQAWSRWYVAHQAWLGAPGIMWWPGPEPVLNQSLTPGPTPSWAELRP